MIDLSHAVWRKSSRSGNADENCVQVADAGPLIAVRDSKNPDGPSFAFTRHEITDLADRIKDGALDL